MDSVIPISDRINSSLGKRKITRMEEEKKYRHSNNIAIVIGVVSTVVAMIGIYYATISTITSILGIAK